LTPSAPDPETTGRRLRLLEATLEQLETQRGSTADDLRGDPLRRAAVERLIQVIIDLALDVNGHLVVALGHPAPETGRESFLAMGRAGVLEPALADRLAPAAGLRNVLVHHYVDVRVDLVAAAIDQVLDDFPRYVRQVAAFLASRS